MPRRPSSLGNLTSPWQTHSVCLSAHTQLVVTLRQLAGPEDNIKMNTRHNTSRGLKSEFHTLVLTSINMAVCWNVAPFSMVETDWRCKGTYYLYLCPDVGAPKDFRSIGQLLPDYKAQRRRRNTSSLSVKRPYDWDSGQYVSSSLCVHRGLTACRSSGLSKKQPRERSRLPLYITINCSLDSWSVIFC
jgi:hypothetical protein